MEECQSPIGYNYTGPSSVTPNSREITPQTNTSSMPSPQVKTQHEHDRGSPKRRRVKKKKKVFKIELATYNSGTHAPPTPHSNISQKQKHIANRLPMARAHFATFPRPLISLFSQVQFPGLGGGRVFTPHGRQVRLGFRVELSRFSSLAAGLVEARLGFWELSCLGRAVIYWRPEC